jgi:putative nucleotidyltransferase with HDIG domain
MIMTTVNGGELRLAEIVSALSHALDLTDGQPEGHSVRCCFIGTHVGRAIGLSDDDMSDLYYTLLLKDLGCSSNAARICRLFVTSDHDFKRNVKLVDNSLPQLLNFVAANTAVRSGLKEKLQTLLRVAMNSGNIDRELIETRCERGAEIARRMHFSEGVARGILDLDEHWDGRGQPLGLKGEAISLHARIALLAQVVDVFHNTAGADRARSELRRRAGRWFDPRLVEAFEAAQAMPGFWQALSSPGLEKQVFALEPAGHLRAVDDSLLDDLADGFAQVIDAKSPYTSGHSKRVALVAELIASEIGIDAAERRTLTRAALLHDIGKLGVTNQVLDKPGKLDDEEWGLMKRHPAMGEAILSRVRAFNGAAAVAAGHHEKLDGTGYPYGRSGSQIGLSTRIVAVADIFDALTADRPYRAAMPTDAALAILRKETGTALDRDCVSALETSLARMAREAA